LEDLGIGEKIILKCFYMEVEGVWFRIGTIGVFPFESSNDPLGFVKGGDFLHCGCFQEEWCFMYLGSWLAS
jgi:hypothetical protein